MIQTVNELASVWVEVLLRDSLLVVVVFVVVAGVARCSRRIGPAFHVALWSLIFVRMLLPPGLSHPMSVGRILGGVVGSDLIQVSQVEASIPSAAVSGWEGAIAEDALGFSRIRSTTAIAAVWLVGAMATFLMFRRRRAVFAKIVRNSLEVEDPEVDDMVTSWRRRLKIRRSVRVVSTTAMVSPFTTGVLRPIVVLPFPIRADRQCLEPVIAHEMAHVARMDDLWLRLQHVIQAAYFFHPVVWISSVKLNEERERLADATAVSAGCLAARHYVGGLLNVLRLDLQGAGAPTMSARKRRIGVRIQNILDREGERRPQVAAAVVGVFFLGVFLLPLGQSGALAESDDANQIENSSSAAAVDQTEFVNPLPDGRVTQTWGPGKRDPFTGKGDVFHRGIDVAAKTGTPVIAPADGVVTVATDAMDGSPASGTVVVLDHGHGLTTRFTHLESFAVSEGQQVAQRELIATVGSTGKSTGPHLHFEVLQDGEALNPAEYVSDWK